jgi:hypothetical protein
VFLPGLPKHLREEGLFSSTSATVRGDSQEDSSGDTFYDSSRSVQRKGKTTPDQVICLRVLCGRSAGQAVFGLHRTPAANLDAMEITAIPAACASRAMSRLAADSAPFEPTLKLIEPAIRRLQRLPDIRQRSPLGSVAGGQRGPGPDERALARPGDDEPFGAEHSQCALHGVRRDAVLARKSVVAGQLRTRTEVACPDALAQSVRQLLVRRSRVVGVELAHDPRLALVALVDSVLTRLTMSLWSVSVPLVARFARAAADMKMPRRVLEHPAGAVYTGPLRRIDAG